MKVLADKKITLWEYPELLTLISPASKVFQDAPEALEELLNLDEESTATIKRDIEDALISKGITHHSSEQIGIVFNVLVSISKGVRDFRALAPVPEIVSE